MKTFFGAVSPDMLKYMKSGSSSSSGEKPQKKKRKGGEKGEGDTCRLAVRVV